MKKTSTCFLYAFNWPNMKHFWKNWTFRSVQELFCWVYIIFQFYIISAKLYTTFWHHWSSWLLCRPSNDRRSRSLWRPSQSGLVIISPQCKLRCFHVCRTEDTWAGKDVLNRPSWFTFSHWCGGTGSYRRFTVSIIMIMHTSPSCTHCLFTDTQYTGHPPLTRDLFRIPTADLC